MAPGLPIRIPPFFDRTVLGVGVPTFPTFHHIEYDPPPPMKTPCRNVEFQLNPSSVSTAVRKLSPDQISTFKITLKKDLGPNVKYSRFEILAAHIWRCLCKARGLCDDQASKLHIATNGPFRLNPSLPAGYIGNVVFAAVSIALSGDTLSETLKYTVERIRKAMKRMDNEFLKSALACIKQQPDLTVLRKGPYMFKCPNLNLSNLSRIPIYNANFGWGAPMFLKLVRSSDGVIIILPSPNNDENLYVAVNLETHHPEFFKKLFYDVMDEVMRSAL